MNTALLKKSLVLFFVLFGATTLMITALRLASFSERLNANATESTASGSLEMAAVSRIIDGDTIVLTCGERVRFIGVDAPETGETGAEEAAQFVSRLILGQNIWLEADGSDRDRFGRLRRYVWIRKPTDVTCPYQIKRYQLNALLLIYGHAETLILSNVANENLFKEIENLRLTYYPNTPCIFLPSIKIVNKIKSSNAY